MAARISRSQAGRQSAAAKAANDCSVRAFAVKPRASARRGAALELDYSAWPSRSSGPAGFAVTTMEP
jgi:hypothetical protein